MNLLRFTQRQTVFGFTLFFFFSFIWKLRNCLFTFSAFRNFVTIDQQNLSKQICFENRKNYFIFSIFNLLFLVIHRKIHIQNSEPFSQKVLVTLLTSFITFQNSSTFVVNMAKVLGKSQKIFINFTKFSTLSREISTFQSLVEELQVLQQLPLWRKNYVKSIWRFLTKPEVLEGVCQPLEVQIILNVQQTLELNIFLWHQNMVWNKSEWKISWNQIHFHVKTLISGKFMKIYYKMESWNL